jgi:hypothetical protein
MHLYDRRFKKMMYADTDDRLIFSDPKDDLNKVVNVIAYFVNYVQIISIQQIKAHYSWFDERSAV